MLSPADIYQRLGEHIELALAEPSIVGEWRQSPVTYDQFPDQPSDEIQHHGFAIAMPSSEPDPMDRQRVAGIRTTTGVQIRWAHRVRADAVVFDTRIALLAEAELTGAIRRIDTNPSLHVDVTRWGRSTTRDGLWFIGELGLRVVHLYST